MAPDRLGTVEAGESLIIPHPYRLRRMHEKLPPLTAATTATAFMFEQRQQVETF